MKEQYIVGNYSLQFGDGDFRVVTASSEDEALLEFAKHYDIHSKYFRELVYTRTVNMSFAENFWTQEDKELFSEEGNLRSDKETFKKNIREFFGEHQAFAELYIDYFFNDDIPIEGAPEHSFPEDMLIYMWGRSEAKDVQAFNLAELAVG